MNSINFQKSITNELISIKNRVRDLIGNAHWGEEGRYKEAVLKNVIRKFLPNSLSIGTGFIVKEDAEQDIVSKQLDIIVYDNTKPVLFNEGDFIITTENYVKAIIEVKSKINITNLREVIDSFNEFNVFNKISDRDNNIIFRGLFAFEKSIQNIEDSQNFDEIIKNSNGMINHICFGKDYFLRHWKSDENLYPKVNHDGQFYNLYKIKDLSFSYFISNLIHMTVDEDLNDRYQYSFPIPGTKEIRRRKTIILQN